MKKNHFLEKVQRKNKENLELYLYAQEQTSYQFIFDLITLVLHDPEYMGKDTFGEERMKKVKQGMEEKFKLYKGALEPTSNIEADYWQEKLDDALRATFKSGDFKPFKERYEFLKDIRY